MDIDRYLSAHTADVPRIALRVPKIAYTVCGAYTRIIYSGAYYIYCVRGEKHACGFSCDFQNSAVLAEYIGYV